MTFCVNPECKQPNNPDDSLVCASCGSKLWLLETYRPIKVIGKGGFGRTFLAINECRPSKPRCAVKQLNFIGKEPHIVEKAIALFEQEAVLLESLGHHAQIPALFAYFPQGERLYIVQEFIEGTTLEQELHEYGVFNEVKIRKLLEDILPVLQFVHEHKVLHRDIKPPNIIIRASDTPEGSGYRHRKPVLIDFGVAKVLQDSSFIGQTTALGTLYYAAPEQLQGSVFKSSDLYSLAVTCIGLITGIDSIQKMYDGGTLTWVWHKFIPKGNVISEGLRQILDKLLQFRPQDRYHSAAEVLSAVVSLTVPSSSVTEIPLPKVDISSPIETPTLLETHLPTSPPNPISNSSNNTNQTSPVGIYYIKLELLFKAQKWQEADLETWKLLCRAIGKPTDRTITSSEFSLIDCEPLLKIDQLWTSASNNKFGFSIQNQIFESVGQDYIKFCQHVEWQSYNSTSYHQSLKFSNQAPVGHLPSRIWAEGDKFWRHLNAIALKLAQCSKKDLS